MDSDPVASAQTAGTTLIAQDVALFNENLPDLEFMSPKMMPFSLDRMVEAVEAVRERLLRASAALAAAEIPYAVTGGNAVAAWVARVDRAAVRNTQDVDILVRRTDFTAVKMALEAVGFEHHELMSDDCFIDGPNGSPRDAVHLLYADEKVKPEYVEPSASVEGADETGPFRVVPLNALVRMKLNSFRLKDQVHLLDMISLNIVNES